MALFPLASCLSPCSEEELSGSEASSGSEDDSHEEEEPRVSPVKAKVRLEEGSGRGLLGWGDMLMRQGLLRGQHSHSCTFPIFSLCSIADISPKGFQGSCSRRRRHPLQEGLKQDSQHTLRCVSELSLEAEEIGVVIGWGHTGILLHVRARITFLWPPSLLPFRLPCRCRPLSQRPAHHGRGLCQKV